MIPRFILYYYRNSLHTFALAHKNCFKKKSENCEKKNVFMLLSNIVPNEFDVTFEVRIVQNTVEKRFRNFHVDCLFVI